MRLRLVGVGPQKAGTTWLYVCLRGHPQLCFPAGVKETFFLDERFEKGWSWYWSHFRHWRDGQYCAEVGPTYFDVPEAVARLRAHNAECRIVVTLRDPVARSFSLYLHHRKKGRLDCDFEEAIRRMPRLLESSRYGRHLSRWIDRFGREQVLVILQEDIASAPAQVLGQVYDFVGIQPMRVPAAATERVNAASLPAFPRLAAAATRLGDWLRDRRLYGPVEMAKALGLKRVYSGFRGKLPALAPAVRERLIGDFEPDIAFVEELIGRSLDAWRRAADRQSEAIFS